MKLKKSQIFGIIIAVFGAVMLFSILKMNWVSRTENTKKGVKTWGEQTGMELLDQEISVADGSKTITLERMVRKGNPDGSKGLGWDYFFIWPALIGSILMIVGGGLGFVKPRLGLGLALGGAALAALLLSISIFAGFFIENDLQRDKDHAKKNVTGERRDAILKSNELHQTSRHLGFWLAAGLAVVGTVISYVGWSNENTRAAFDWDDEEDEKSAASKSDTEDAEA